METAYNNVSSNKISIKRDLIGILLAVVSAVMLAGVNTWFKTCAPMEDGSFMACHWAGRTIAAAAAMSLILALVRLAIGDRMVKTGLDIALAASAVFTMLVPGRIINLCMMEEMMCRSHTQPWTMGLSALLLIAALADIFFMISGASAEKHRRNK